MSVNLSMVKWNLISVEIFKKKKNCLLYNAERDIYYISQNKIFSISIEGLDGTLRHKFMTRVIHQIFVYIPIF